MSRPRRVLVTYGWCRTAYVAVKALASRGYEVFTCDSRSPAMCRWSRLTRAGARVADPFTAPDAFTGEVARLVRRWSVDVILPGHEDGLVLRRHQNLLPRGVVLACPDLTMFETTVDKARTTRVALESGVPVPRTRFPTTVDGAIAAAEEIGFPLVAKVRRSNSGKGVARVTDPDELLAVLRGPFRRFCEAGERFPIVQQLVPGEVVGACVLAEGGSTLALFQERYLRCKDGDFGTSTYRVPMASERVAEVARRMIRALRFTGIGHFDLILPPENGGPVLLEMNPRLWGALNLAHVNGHDFASAAVAQALGEPDLGQFFAPRRKPLASLWIAGELIAAVNRMKSGEWSAPLRTAVRIAGSAGSSRYDDLVWHDPMPLVAELLCYGTLWRRAGGSTNPEVEGMLE